MLRILLAIFIFAVTLSAEQYSLNKFTGGLNTRISPVLLPEGSTPDCQNVLFDDSGGVKKRKGYKYIGYSSSTVIGTRLYPLSRASGAKFLFKQAGAELWVSVTGVSWTLLRSDLRWQVNVLNSAVISNDRWFVNGIDSVFSSNGRTYTTYPFIKKGKFITSKAEGSSGILYDRVFVANTYDFPSGVYYSDLAYAPDSSDAWSELQIFLVGASDGEVITGLYVWKGDLYIFKTRSVWRLAGNSPDNWVLRRLTREYGCAEQGTIKEYQNILVFLSNEKRAVVGFDGSFFKELSEPIEPDLDNWDNLEGFYNYWIQSVQSDFVAGTSTGLLVSDYLTLEDVSKVWSSSATYPTAFSSGTKSNLSNIGDSLKLKDTTVKDPGVVVIDNIANILWKSNTNAGYIPFEAWNELYKFYDTDDNKENTYAYPNLDIEQSWVWMRVNGNDTYKKMTFEFNLSTTSTLTDIHYKMNVKNPATFFAIAFNKAVWESYPSTIMFYIETYYSVHTNVGWSDEEELASYQFEYTHADLLAGDWRQTMEGLWTQGVTLPKEKELLGDFEILKSDVDKIKLSVKYGLRSSEGTNNLFISNYGSFAYDLYQITLQQDASATITHKSTGAYKTQEYDFEGQVYLGTATFITSPNNMYSTIGGTITHQIRSKLTSWTTYYPISDGEAIPSQLSPCQYVQVLSSFTTIYSSYTPTLQSIKIGAVKSTGSWESDWFQADKVAGWKYAIFDDETPTDTGISYAVRTATGSMALDSASWDWLDSGDLLDAGIHPSSHTYIQEKSTMVTTNGIRIPTLFSTTILWYPESEPIRPCAGIVDKRYWLGVSTYTGYNDNIYILDKNMVWTKNVGITPTDIVAWKGETYILDGSTTAIWQVNYGSADRWYSATSSATINAYWTSKPLFLALDREVTLEHLYSSLGATGGDVKLGYALFPDDFTEHTIDVSGTREVNDRKKVTTGELGKIWNFKVADNSTEPAFQFNNLSIFYKIKPLR